MTMSLPRTALGDGLSTSAIGFGAMSLSSVYGEADDTESLATLHKAVDLGVTFIDTANIYGMGSNEELIAKLLRERRDEVQLATKFGIESDPRTGEFRLRGDREHARESLEASLRRLGTDHVDLYYLHRPAPDTPVEDSVAAMAEFVAEGKVRHIGLSEVTSAELRRANAVHPIAAVQSEWSIFSRDVERAVVPAAAELGVGFVPYAPMGRGFLAGQVTSSSFDGADFRRLLPRFNEENLAANLKIADLVRDVGAQAGATPAQTAIAWLYAKGRQHGLAVTPIPGTRRAARVEENAGAVGLRLSEEALARLDEAAQAAVGPRSITPISADRE
ncbi:aldo/keto reductase [Segniliparus rugosus]|uniref:NADP-dependent oxidoreductase domain-containing protein n=1 Tax=Segniliparus rugosus (strain ATCC BAA-974 / DSM 45345 / CCUG 50838 / CIP 108380 / JCM 13579 / CDC 945) TaxID=679197 RepID=E5XUT0_SEGRC|nr:aldo/keto reductase [Segniliparus rugosus]EFV11918.1 hypothetical protein HMPREF9336_03252 [Segniliparus rugosus ATCC BAA-974]